MIAASEWVSLNDSATRIRALSDRRPTAAPPDSHAYNPSSTLSIHRSGSSVPVPSGPSSSPGVRP